ncbi:MAG: hypothetical protein KUL75_02500 [Sterolibacterium sp.]|nr:hypothetical protein [Sterolibacterium sp.]
MNKRLHGRQPPKRHRQTEAGAALLLVLLILVLFALTTTVHYFHDNALAEHNSRQQIDQRVLAHAREALIGSALTYRDTHPSENFGYLRCPDIANEKGEAAAPCGARDTSSLGRLPWKTLGIPVLRDHAGECLWYAVSGRAKNNPKTTQFNWDTTGQFIVRDHSGTILAGTQPHERPLALLFSPGFAIGTQTRPRPSPNSGTPSECAGNPLASAYLESLTTLDDAITPITLSTTTAQNNDRISWLTSDDIFRPLMQHPDFRLAIDTLLDDFSACLGNWKMAQLPPTSATQKGLLNAAMLCSPAALEKENNFRNNWEDQLLYTRPPASATAQIDGSIHDNCAAVLLFGGLRTTWQSRADSIEQNDPAMYLEGNNAARFPASGLYTGNRSFSASTPERELLRCIRSLPEEMQQVSFVDKLDEFLVVGDGLNKKKERPAAPADPATPSGKSSISFIGNTSAASCLWYPQPLPLAGRAWRIYYTFRFEFSDTHATSTNPATADRGKGFTLQLVRGDLGAPENCGSLADMGILNSADPRGAPSLLIETDVHRDTEHNDPAGNHSAILLDGTLSHETTLGSLCTAQVTGCRHTPASKFEDSPMATHNQRVEIRTGCNSSCSSCDPATHGSSDRSHALIQVWIDCQQCLSVRNPLVTAQAPSLARCVVLPTELGTAYVGFTGGFLPPAPGQPTNSAPRQGVSIGNFYLGIE